MGKSDKNSYLLHKEDWHSNANLFFLIKQMHNSYVHIGTKNILKEMKKNKIQILYTWDFHQDFSIIQPASYDKIVCPLLLLEAFLYAWRSSWHWPLFLLSHFKEDRYKSLLQMINLIFLMTIWFLFAKRIYVLF